MTGHVVRIRSDLKATPTEEQGVKYVDVTDPRSGAKMRLYDFEWLIAERLDGAHPLDEIARWAKDRLGWLPSVADLKAYADKLAELGFLEEGPAGTSNGHRELVDDEDEEIITSDMTPLPPAMPLANEAGEDEPTRKTAVDDHKVAFRPDPQALPQGENIATAATIAPGTLSMPVVPKPAEAPKPAAQVVPLPKISSPEATGSTGRVTAAGPATAAAMDAAGVQPKKSSALSLVLLLLVVLGVAGAFAYMKLFRAEVAHVTVTLATPREVVRLFDGTGAVKKTDAQSLSFGEAGKVTDVVGKGTEVKAGMPLATLESHVQIEKLLNDVKDRASFYQKQLENAKSRNDEKAVRAAEAKVEEKHKLLNELEARASKVRIVAPAAGTVSEVLVAPGGEVKPGQPAIKIGDKRLTVDFTVPAAEAPKVGAVATVQPTAGAPIKGKVAQVTGGTVVVELPESAPVKAGEALRLVKKKEPNVIPVPATALVKREGAEVVFVLSGGEAHARPVTIVDRTPTEVLVSSTSLSPGDSVITTGADTLTEGQKASAQ